MDHGSIIGASAALHLTQSSVTRRIQNLEDILGVGLLDRQTRPRQPTPAGTQTYEIARPILSSIGDLKTAITHDGEPSGDFRFGMPRGLGDLAVASPIRRLREEFPRLKLHSFVQWSEMLVERLQNRTLDASIVVLPEGKVLPETLVAELLDTRPQHVVAGKLTKFDRDITLEALSKNQWVLNPIGCPTRLVLQSALLQKRLPFDCIVEAEGHELQFSLIADGVGLGLALSEAVRSSAYRKNLKLLTVKDFVLPPQCVWLLYSKHIGRMAPAVRCLKKVVQESLNARRS